MMMNKANEASTSRIVEIILRSIHLSDETPVEESLLFVEPCSKGRLQPLNAPVQSNQCGFGLCRTGLSSQRALAENHHRGFYSKEDSKDRTDVSAHQQPRHKWNRELEKSAVCKGGRRLRQSTVRAASH